MIRHLVLFKLDEGVERDDPRVLEGVDAFRSLDGKIQGHEIAVKEASSSRSRTASSSSPQRTRRTSARS